MTETSCLLSRYSRVSASYLALMILSTVLATVGLYLNNAAVIIGAMILAPLMAPLVSSAMGLLRGDSELFWSSNRTIVVGVLIALATAAMTTLAFPHKPVTSEMLEIGLKHIPNACCLVPEKRREVTTEGGLNAAAKGNQLPGFIRQLKDKGIRV